MKSCTNHIGKRVFSKGLCAQCYKIKYPSTLKRSPLKKKPFFIRTISDKRKGQNKTYTALRKEFLIKYPLCQIRGSNCTGRASEVHHSKGRENKLLLEEKWWKATCHNCHTEITNNSAKAIEEKHSLSRHENIF